MTKDLLERPLRDLRISVIDACNFRCSYCMPAERFPADYPFLKATELLNFPEIVAVATAAAALGVTKIKLTGGEPLTRPFLPELVAQLKVAVPGVELDLITNGWHLKPLIERFKAAGLDRITVSLDSLDPGVFGKITGRGYRVGQVVEAIEAAHQAGFAPLKVNMVVMRGVNDQEIEAMAEYFRRPGFILRFIEYMDVGNMNGWKRDQVVPSHEILSRLQARWSLRPVERLHPGETAERWGYGDVETEIGFISAVTKPFCGDCTRLRLSADGQLHTCLFSRKGHDLRALLRNGAGAAEIEASIAGLWTKRTDRYSEERAGLGPAKPGGANQKIEMFAIGG